MTEFTVPWWKQAVFYHIYPRSFHDSRGDGVGDLPGILAKLDYLVDLGVDAIWLSPVFPSPMVDFGYDIIDHTDIDPLFGSLTDMEKLLQAVHRRRLRLILDLVPNHTSNQHPWFVDSRSSRQSDKRSWYLWHDPAPDGGPPNNWLAQFGGSAWEFDSQTGQYYMHTFLPEQPDLNWREPAVQQAMEQVMRFWLDLGVDGFRVDAITHLIKDKAWRDNPTLPQAIPGRDRGDAGRQDHRYDQNRPGTHDVIRQMRRTLQDYQPERVMAGEVYVFDPATAAAYFGNGDECHLVYNFNLPNQPWQAPAMRAAYERLHDLVPESGEMALLLGGHDEPRLASRYGPEAARSAAVLVLTLKGTPFIYYGDELGMQDVPVPVEKMQDPLPFSANLPHLSRDPSRTPMLWSANPGAGFSAVEDDREPPEAWLPLSPNASKINVQSQASDPDSVLNFYKRLLRLRRERPSLHHGDYLSLTPDSDSGHAYFRRAQDETTLVAINFTQQAIRLELGPLPPSQLLLSTYATAPTISPTEGISLRPHEAVLLDLKPAD